MTTIKEYKAMMEGATDAVAFVCRTLGWLEVVPPYGDKVDRTKECDKAIIECGKIRDALNKQADIIRVIELAEEALEDAEGYSFGNATQQEHEARRNALSEIRKLRG
jgi:hypothetical protein